MSLIGLTEPATIAALSAALTRAGVDGIEISNPAGHLRIVVSNGKVSHSTRSHQPPAAASVVRAPLAGHFRPIEPAFESGTKSRELAKGDVLGFIAIGPILLPLLAPHAGTIRRHLAEADALVGFGAKLFELEQTS